MSYWMVDKPAVFIPALQQYIVMLLDMYFYSV
jgi:hypothetical protein